MEQTQAVQVVGIAVCEPLVNGDLQRRPGGDELQPLKEN